MTKTLPAALAKTDIKEIDYSKFLPFATAGLIFLGITRLVYYYNYFGVNIVSFLDFGEIITSFLDLVVAFVVIIGFSWVQYIRTPEKEKDNNETEKLPKKKSKRAIWNWTWAFLALSATLIYLIYTLSHLLYRNWKGLVIFILVFGIGVLAAYWIYRFCNKHPSKLIRDLGLASIILVLSEMLIIFAAISEYRDVKHNHKYLGTKIVFNNETPMKDSSHTIISDSSHFYIGKTNNYIFIHHKKEATTSVYPMSNVLQIDLKTKSVEKNFFLRLID